MALSCLFGRHRLEKFLGPINAGNGKFTQKYKCTQCGKVTEKSN